MYNNYSSIPHIIVHVLCECVHVKSVLFHHFHSIIIALCYGSAGNNKLNSIMTVLSNDRKCCIQYNVIPLFCSMQKFVIVVNKSIDQIKQHAASYSHLNSLEPYTVYNATHPYIHGHGQ